MTKGVEPQQEQEPMTLPFRGDRQIEPSAPEELLTRVYALILSWPTAEEKAIQLREHTENAKCAQK